MKLRLPWQKESVDASTLTSTATPCSHPRVEVELHGTAIKRRWCALCGQELPLAEPSGEE